ncbi:MAG: GbsR/MarR family transcriptional regulator [Coraliomargaritaceae bacterium]
MNRELSGKSTPTAVSLSASWELATIEVFVRAAGLIGFPRSIGEIYGVLYCAEQALTFDDLVERLGISRGSVSQGLKLLRQLGAVRTQYVMGSRKDHFVPELSMKRLAKGFVRDQFTPHLESGASRLDQIEVLIEEEDVALRDHALSRIRTLRTWQARTAKLVPIVMAVLGGSRILDKEESGPEPI